MSHLWEADHDYYGASQNYFATGSENDSYHTSHESWAEFLEDSGFAEASLGLNFLYRWDWQKWGEDDVDDDAPREELELFFIMPRKGILSSARVQVTEADEPAVREWLQKHVDYMRNMWAPLELGVTE